MSRPVGVAFTLLLMSCFLFPGERGSHLPPAQARRETNEKYGSNYFWPRPRVWTTPTRPARSLIQKLNLYPDVGSTYFVAQYAPPRGRQPDLPRQVRLRALHVLDHVRPARASSARSPRPTTRVTPPDQARQGIGQSLQASTPCGFSGPRNYTFHVVSARSWRNGPRTRSTPRPQTRRPLGEHPQNHLPDRGRDGTGDAGLPARPHPGQRNRAARPAGLRPARSDL